MILYKYLCPSRASILENCLVRFTPPGEFNDPFDCLPYFVYDPPWLQKTVNEESEKNRIKLELEGRAYPEEIWRHVTDTQFKNYLKNPGNLSASHVKKLRERMDKEIGILCLSESNSSILMWSHYAGCHSGFVLGLDSDSNFFKKRHREQEIGEIGELRPVTYSAERTKINYPPSDTDQYDIFFTKNEEWSYEKEWRILRFQTNADVTQEQKIHLFAIPPSAIKEVILGRSAQPELISALASARKSTPELNHVQFYRADLSYNSFKMDVIPFPI